MQNEPMHDEDSNDTAMMHAIIFRFFFIVVLLFSWTFHPDSFATKRFRGHWDITFSFHRPPESDMTVSGWWYPEYYTGYERSSLTKITIYKDNSKQIMQKTMNMMLYLLYRLVIDAKTDRVMLYLSENIWACSGSAECSRYSTKLNAASLRRRQNRPFIRRSTFIVPPINHRKCTYTVCKRFR